MDFGVKQLSIKKMWDSIKTKAGFDFYVLLFLAGMYFFLDHSFCLF